MITFRAACLVVTVFLATSCAPDAPVKLEPVDSRQPDGQAGRESQETETESITSTNGMLTVSPAIIDLCRAPEGVVSVDVTWDASSTGTEGTQVWLESPGEGKKLWSQEGAKGEARTGEWMRDGSKVILVGSAGVELAQIEISARTCPK